jgi:hypothetical protein
MCFPNGNCVVKVSFANETLITCVFLTEIVLSCKRNAHNMCYGNSALISGDVGISIVICGDAGRSGVGTSASSSFSALGIFGIDGYDSSPKRISEGCLSSITVRCCI